MDKAEISNNNWKDYMYYIKRKFGSESENYKMTIPDTSVWASADTTGFVINMYFQHPAFSEYPVVGISYAQAEAYCKWRTEITNKTAFLNENKIKGNPDSTYSFPTKFIYRLPTRREWEYAASAGLDTNKFPLGYEKIINKKNLPKIATIESREFLKYYSVEYWPGDVYFGDPNKFGLYNMAGNVAEMTSEEGIAKGGSWHHTLQESYIGKDIHYEGPTNWLGFRCICEMKKQ